MIDRSNPWPRARAARFPVAGLAALAALRCHRGVTVDVHGGWVWAFWQPGDEALVRCLRPVTDVEFFERRGDHWHRLGRRLVAEVRPPVDTALPLDRVLFPERCEPLSPPDRSGQPFSPRLIRSGRVQPTTALCCRVADLARWADTATTAELAGTRAARCGARVVLVGARLPAIGARFWGQRVLVPLGLRVEPDWPEVFVRSALGIADDELVIWGANGPEAVADCAFAPLTRAGLRLAQAALPE